MHEFGVIVMRCLEKHPADFANFAEKKTLKTHRANPQKSLSIA